jgi:hypothetical protein
MRGATNGQPSRLLKCRPANVMGRLQLSLILVVVIGPMILASAMYRRFWVPRNPQLPRRTDRHRAEALNS